MGKSSLKLDKRRALADGTYPVKIKVGYGTNIYINTGVYLKPAEWNANAQLCTSKQAKIVNNILSQSLTRITNRLLELRETGQYSTYNRAQLRQMLIDLTLDAPTVGVPSVADYVNKYAGSCGEKTSVHYRLLLAKLGEFCDVKRLTLPEMSSSWWQDFSKHLSNSGLKHNTTVSYMKRLKAVVRAAERDGETVNAAYRYIDVKEEATRMRNLSVEDMRKIRDAELTGASVIYRDAFMLSFYLVGINAADLLQLNKSDVVNGRISYRRAKTGKLYSVKVEPEAQALIDKYAAPDGDKRLLNFGRRNSVSFCARVGHTLTKIITGVTWYYARYSWANFAIDLDIPKDTVSEALGHTHGAAVTGVYIRYTHDKIDKANRQVLDYFAGKK